MFTAIQSISYWPESLKYRGCDISSHLLFAANLKVDWKKKLCIGCAVVFILSVIAAILSLTGALVCTLIQHDQQEWHTTHKAEILQGDTILAYLGSDPRVEFTACFEETDADNPTRQLDVTLIAVHCENLVEHSQPFMVFDYPIKSKDIFKEPIYVPGGYNHYESGPAFVFWVESQNVPESSGIFIRVFDNTAEADSYKYHPTDTNARDKAIWMKQVETNTSFNVTFDPPYASYFLPTFEANIAGGDFEFTLSYSVRQIYYQYSDYAKNVDIRCVLNSSNPCYFHLSEWNETCILAYNPPSYTDDTNAVMLTTQRHTSIRRHIIHRKISHPLWTFFLLFVVVCSLCVIYFLIRYCKCSCKHLRKGYAPVVLIEAPLLVDSTITDNG